MYIDHDIGPTLPCRDRVLLRSEVGGGQTTLVIRPMMLYCKGYEDFSCLALSCGTLFNTQTKVSIGGGGKHSMWHTISSYYLQLQWVRIITGRVHHPLPFKGPCFILLFFFVVCESPSSFPLAQHMTIYIMLPFIIQTSSHFHIFKLIGSSVFFGTLCVCPL